MPLLDSGLWTEVPIITGTGVIGLGYVKTFSLLQVKGSLGLCLSTDVFTCHTLKHQWIRYVNERFPYNW